MVTGKRKWMAVLAAALVAAAGGTAFLNTAPAEETQGGKGYVAVIRIDGTIYGGPAADNLWGQQGGAASEALMEQFRKAREDNHAKAVLVRINSPGGSSAATQEIAEEMDKLRNTGKPVIISMGDMCASAGYWLASKGDYIFANPSTITGSIGVYMDYTNVEDLMGKLGVRNEKIKSGAHKDILSMYRPMTGEEKAMLQKMVDDIYNQFVRVVADGRHMDEGAVRRIADGRVLTGQQAQEAGLVDAMGNYYDALDYAGSRVGMNGAHIPTRSYEKKPPFKGLLSAEMENVMTGRLADQLAESFKKSLSESQAPVIR